MMDGDGFDMRKSTRKAAAKAAKRIKKNAEENADNYPDFQVTQSDAETSDDKKQRRRDHKRKTENQVFDSAKPQLTLEASKNNSECSYSPKSDMSKKRRRRPANSEKCALRRRKSMKYNDATCKEEDENDGVNLRRESYNEPKLPTPFPGSKQLVVGDGGVSYQKSLMNFTKGMGPTAETVARQILERRGPTHQLEGLVLSQNALITPHRFDLNSINNSVVKNTSANQVSPPAISFEEPYGKSIVSKGKSIMIDDGKGDREKWSVADSMELLFGKQKCGIKIGSGSLGNKDFGNKKVEIGQVGNQIGSFFTDYDWNLNPNTNKNSGIQDIVGQKEASWNASNRIPNANIFPSTNVPSRSYNMSSSSLGFNNDVSKFSWVPQPPMHSPTAVHQPKNWCPPTTALAVNRQTKEKEYVWSQNLWAPSQTHQFLQAHSSDVPAQPQPQDRVLKPTPPTFWSEMAMPANKVHELNFLPFGTQQDFGGNRLQHPQFSQTHQFLQAHSSHGPAQHHQLLNPASQTFWSERSELQLLPFGTQQDSGVPKGNRMHHSPPGF